MPKLLSQTEVQLNWPDLDTWKQRPLPKSASQRSPGVHLSGVIKAVLKSLGKLKEWKDLEEDEMPLNVVMGIMWEQYVVGLPGLKDVIWQPGEVERDGVYLSPDGVMEVEGTRQVSTYRVGVDRPEQFASRFKEVIEELIELQEFKATWRSEFTYGKDILQMTAWVWQLAGYCYAMGLVQACLHVLWVNGGYRPPRPKYVKYRVRFEEEELKVFWENVVVKNKSKAEAEA